MSLEEEFYIDPEYENTIIENEENKFLYVKNSYNSNGNSKNVYKPLSATAQINHTDGIFIDKYEPQSFEELHFDKSLVDKLRLYARKNMSHILINGPRGSCKKTFVKLFLKMLYPDIQFNTGIVEIKTKQSKKLELKIIKSNYHIQLNPSDYGVYDRLIVQEFINDMMKISTKHIQLFVIENADSLTVDAQECLRRTLEKYIENCRFIFISSNNSTVIDPLYSRCTKFRLNAPSNDYIHKVLNTIVKKESISISDEMIHNIVDISDRNIKKALNYLNIYNIKKTIVDQTDEPIETIAMLFQNTTNCLQNIKCFRENLYIMLVHCIEPLDICKRMWKYIQKDLSDDTPEGLQRYLKASEGYVTCCDNLKKCNKPIYHLEEFVLFLYAYVWLGEGNVRSP